LTKTKVALLFTADGTRWEPEAGEEDGAGSFHRYFFSHIRQLIDGWTVRT